MTTAQRNINLPLDQILAFCRRNPIQKLSLFGSVLRDDFTDKSDVDFLVEFRPGTLVTYFTLAELEIGLEEIVGRKVDLRLPGELNRRFRSQVIESSEQLYAATNAL
jgi:predicted nucleotidyltransferase